MSEWSVSEESVSNIKDTSARLTECAETLTQITETLKRVHEETGDGLGAHARDVGALIASLQADCDAITAQTKVLSLKLIKAATIRQSHLDTNRYTQLGHDAAGAATAGAAAAAGAAGAAAGVAAAAGGSAAGGTRETGGIFGLGGPTRVAESTGSYSAEFFDRKTPRDLLATQQTFHTDEDGGQTYNSPLETSRYLCPEQGHARKRFGGTCGLCSIANILRLAGVQVSEGDIIDYAANNPAPNSLSRLCETDSIFPGMNGATDANDRKAILEHFGISSGVFDVSTDSSGRPDPSNIDNIAQYISEGRGVIISVHAQKLWYGVPLESPHAICVTSVKKDRDGKVEGFYVNDTGKSGGGTYYYPASKLNDCLTGTPMNVTYQRIR